jgi:hypothetical protein
MLEGMGSILNMDDKQQYIDTLKSLTTSKIKKVKVESKEQVLMEQKKLETMQELYQELVREIFVQSGEIEAMPKGQFRDMQILRLGIIAETDASNLYEKLALLASDKRVKKVMQDVSREEKVHFGEFEAILEEIDPEFEKAEEEGESEAEDMM